MRFLGSERPFQIIDKTPGKRRQNDAALSPAHDAAAGAWLADDPARSPSPARLDKPLPTVAHPRRAQRSEVRQSHEARRGLSRLDRARRSGLAAAALGRVSSRPWFVVSRRRGTSCRPVLGLPDYPGPAVPPRPAPLVTSLRPALRAGTGAVAFPQCSIGSGAPARSGPPSAARYRSQAPGRPTRVHGSVGPRRGGPSARLAAS